MLYLQSTALSYIYLYLICQLFFKSGPWISHIASQIHNSLIRNKVGAFRMRIALSDKYTEQALYSSKSIEMRDNVAHIWNFRANSLVVKFLCSSSSQRIFLPHMLLSITWDCISPLPYISTQNVPRCPLLSPHAPIGYANTLNFRQSALT